jgi:hypothetical protein
LNRRLIAAAGLIVALAGCKEEKVTPLSENESADAKAAAYNFQIYPKAEFLPKMTDVLRRVHFVLHPDAKQAPPTAAYHVDATVEQVAEFYATRYGHGRVAPNSVNNFSSAPPAAYYRTGDLHADASSAIDIMNKLQLKSDVSKAIGTYKGAHVSGTANFPRVTIQRPYFDHLTSQVVDKTLIILVKE